MTERGERRAEGGEAACMLDLVCPECGAVREGADEHRCAAPRDVRRREDVGR
jgi:hypothetical protein